MAQKHFPARHLLMYQDAILKINQRHPEISLFMTKMFRQWYNDNGVRLESLKDKIKKLQEEFVVFEGEGKDRKMKVIPAKRETIPAVKEMRKVKTGWFTSKMEEVVIEPEKIIETKADVVFLEGKTEEEFNKRYNELLNEEVPIII